MLDYCCGNRFGHPKGGIDECDQAGLQIGLHNREDGSNIDQIRTDALLTSSRWWEQAMREYGGAWVGHDQRYERTREFIEVMRGMCPKKSSATKAASIKSKRLTRTKTRPQTLADLYAGGNRKTPNK